MTPPQEASGRGATPMDRLWHVTELLQYIAPPDTWLRMQHDELQSILIPSAGCAQLIEIENEMRVKGDMIMAMQQELHSLKTRHTDLTQRVEEERHFAEQKMVMLIMDHAMNQERERKELESELRETQMEAQRLGQRIGIETRHAEKGKMVADQMERDLQSINNKLNEDTARISSSTSAMQQLHQELQLHRSEQGRNQQLLASLKEQENNLRRRQDRARQQIDEARFFGAMLHGDMETMLGGVFQPEEGGLRIVEVHPNSALSSTSLKPNDMLVSLNHTKVRSSADLRAAYRLCTPGQMAAVVAFRDGVKQTSYLLVEAAQRVTDPSLGQREVVREASSMPLSPVPSPPNSPSNVREYTHTHTSTVAGLAPGPGGIPGLHPSLPLPTLTTTTVNQSCRLSGPPAQRPHESAASPSPHRWTSPNRSMR